MLKQASKNDLNSILDFVKKKKNENIYIIADIESIEYDCKDFIVWYSEDKNKINSVFLKYKNNMIIYSDNEYYEVREIFEIINDNNITRINGFEDSMKPLLPFLKDYYKLTESFFCAIDDTKHLIDSKRTEILNDQNIEIASQAMNEVVEFEASFDESYQMLNSKLKQNLPTRLLKINNKVVSFASVSTISTYSAMIVAVFTVPNERGKGYAKEVLSSLIKDMKKINKECCLVYENETAGKLYMSMGFQSLGKWLIFDYKK